MDSARLPRGAQRLRQANRESILARLRTTGAMSRAELARELGLSPTTASSIVAELVADGLVGESEPTARGGRGRPGRLVRATTPPGTIVGIDVGRRHVQVAVARRDARVIAERFIDTTAGQDRETTTTMVLALIEELYAESGADRSQLLAVGVGLPGPIEQDTHFIATGTILPEWVGYDLVTILRKHLGVPVALDNDANLGILGEAGHGAARGFQHAIYVKVSTGIGSGMMLGGVLHRGAGGTAGELGHLSIEPDGAVCRCGGRGCLETVASVPALLAMLAPTLGDDVELSRVLDLAAQGNRGCLRAITDVGHGIGRALAAVCNLLNPEVIVIGGPLLRAEQPFLEAIREAVGRGTTASNITALEVRPAELGRRAELVGALALAMAAVPDGEHSSARDSLD